MHFQSKTTHNAQTVNVTLMAQEYEMHVVKLQLDLEVKIEELEKQVWSVFTFFRKTLSKIILVLQKSESNARIIQLSEELARHKTDAAERESKCHILINLVITMEHSFI